MDHPEEFLRVEAQGEIHRLVLNRPDRLNAIHEPMAQALLAYFEARRRDASIRVILIRGAGRGFCAGADLKSYGQADQLQDGPNGDWVLRDMLRAMRACPQPIVSLVHGPAAGGGMAIALASDVILAGESASFHPAFIRLGLSGSELGVGWRLQRMIGISRARESLFANRPISAADALRLGLVSSLTPDDQLDSAGLQLADEMLKAAPDALRLTKRSLDADLETPSYEMAMEAQERAQMLMIARGALRI